MKNKLLKIINYYGVDNQLRKFSEENFELIEAMTNLNYAIDYKPSELIGAEKYYIKSEIADNFVLLSQFILYYNIDLDDIEKIFKNKVERQLKRMEGKK